MDLNEAIINRVNEELEQIRQIESVEQEWRAKTASLESLAAAECRKVLERKYSVDLSHIDIVAEHHQEDWYSFKLHLTDGSYSYVQTNSSLKLATISECDKWVALHKCQNGCYERCVFVDLLDAITFAKYRMSPKHIAMQLYTHDT